MNRFIRIEFAPGVSEADYDKFVEIVLELTDKTMKAYPPDCDNEIWVSGQGGSHS